MLLKYLDGPHTIVRWGASRQPQTDFLFRPTGVVPDEFGKLILASPDKVGRFEEVKEVKPQTGAVSTQVTPTEKAEVNLVHSAFVCDFCQKPAKSKAGLAAHKRTHKEKI